MSSTETTAGATFGFQVIGYPYLMTLELSYHLIYHLHVTDAGRHLE